MKKLLNKIKIILFLIGQINVKRPFSYSDIIIYDNHHPDIMDKLLKGRNYQEIKPKSIYLSLSVILKMLLNIRFASGGIFYWNHACLILFNKPKVVITLIDNSKIFYKLDNALHGKIRFLTIQNGNRFFNPLGLCKVINPELTEQEKTACLYNTYHSEFFCFGEFETDLYRKLSATVDKFYPVGSLANSIYMDMAEDGAESYDLCLSSAYFTDVQNSWPRYFESFGIVCEWLAAYLKDRPEIKFCIAARSLGEGSNSEKEIEWYKKYGLEKYLRFRDDKYATYRIVDASKVTICAMSTVYFEALARGKKAILVDPVKFEIMMLPTLMEPNPLLYLYESNYESFKDRIYELINIDKLTYENETKDYAKYMMNNSQTEPTFKIIQNHIASIVN